MAKDLTVVLENRPGTFAEMGEATGRAGVNIDGLCGFPCEGSGMLHILVDDATSARRALEAAGFEVGEDRDVLLLREGVDFEDRPGALGEVTRRIADAGVNIDLMYSTWNGEVVLGADDVEKARAAV